MYKPVFRTDVRMQGPQGPYSINKNLCLTDASAEELAALLRKQVGWDGVLFIITIEQRPPQILMGSGWSSGEVTVPFLVTQDGPDSTGDEARFSSMNAGQIADIWMHYPDPTATRFAVYTVGLNRHYQNPDRNALPNL